MPVDVINVSKDVPRATRKRHSALEDTQEWVYVMTKLQNGLKPNEGLRVVLSQKVRSRIKHADRLFKQRIQRVMKDLKLDYDVFWRGQTEDGALVLFIANPDKRFT